MSPSGNRGTWTALGQTEAITFSDNGNAVVLKEVKGQTEFRGTEVPPGVFKGIVSQESTSGGCFRLEEKKAIEHSLLHGDGLSSALCSSPDLHVWG